MRNVLKLVTILFSLLLSANFARAQTDPSEEEPFPETVPILPIPGMHLSKCNIREPAVGHLRSFKIAGVGTYRAYGSSSLLPTEITIALGEGAPEVGRILFGAETDFVMEDQIKLRASPSPVDGTPSGPMAQDWGGRVRHLAERGLVVYRLPITAKIWELMDDHGQSTCLYFQNSQRAKH